jgi:hypothetical protein
VVSHLGFAFGHGRLTLLRLGELLDLRRRLLNLLDSSKGSLGTTFGHSQGGKAQSGDYEESFHGFHLGILKYDSVSPSTPHLDAALRAELQTRSNLNAQALSER